ncbi:MAG: hypothetical protein WC718_15390 [Phycisphaerales bacterium]|jgi:hypothetical protein
MPKDPNEIGALWIKQGSKGDYMTGTINEQPVVCFRNKSENPKAPAWRVLKPTPRPETHPEPARVTDAIGDDPFPF